MRCATTLFHNFRPTATPLGHKLGKPSRRRLLPGCRHQPLVIGQVVDREQHRPEHFVGLKQMPQIAAAVPAGRARAVGFERLAVLRVLLIAQPQRAPRR